MRKIQTQAEIDKKKRKNQITIGGVMITLLVLSIIGYSFTSGNKNGGSSKVNEMGINFFRQNGLWVTEINGNVFSFQNLPSEVLNVDINISSITFGQYSGQPLYFVNSNEGSSEILNNFGKYVLRYQDACFENMTCSGDLPEKDCDNNLIIFESGNVTKVYENRNCVFIVGDPLKGTDAFLYKVLQII